jgi:hypothetical protein
MVNPLTKILLSKRLPVGGRNNVLIFNLKILLFNEGFAEGDVFVKRLFHKIGVVQGELFPANLPATPYFFSEKNINEYFFSKGLPPIYK